MHLLGKILATALLALEDAGQGYTNEATIPEDVQNFASGIIQVWFQKQAAAKAAAQKQGT